jgi:hypothetical protein
MNSPHFIEPESLLPLLQVPATCPCPEPDQCSPCRPSHFPKIHLNIILQSTAGPSKWFLSLRSLYQNPLYTCPSPIRTTCPAHLILLDFIIRTILGEECRFLSSSLCSFFFQFPCYLVPLRPNYSSLHPILKHPQPAFLPQCDRLTFTPLQNNRKNYSSCIS